MQPEIITLSRSCESMEIPSGITHTLPAGTRVRVMQKLGGSYTVMGLDVGGMYRIDPKDADALGLTAATEQAPTAPQGELTEEMVWRELRTVYDPEIPVNVYELGLVYGIDVDPAGVVTVRMTLTSPACPVAGSLPPEVESKVRAIPGVTDAKVDLVWDPPWNPNLMSEAAKLQLGIF